MIFKNIKSNFRDVPEIPFTEIRRLWHSGYYDGPLSGMLKYQDKEYWFDCFEDGEQDPDKRFRRFAVIELTPEQLEQEHYWHKLFQEHVGTHTDYDENGNRNHSGVKRGNWNLFYDKAKAERVPLDISENNVIGWFER